MSTTRKRLLELDKRGKSTFVYTKASDTDLHAKFAKIKRQQKEAEAVKPVPAANVQAIKPARKIA